jgi:hypothetical protein
MYWVIIVAAMASFTAMFTLLLFLVHQLRPKTFKVKAAITRWVSIEVEFESPEPTNLGIRSVRPKQQRTAVIAPTTAVQDHPAPVA